MSIMVMNIWKNIFDRLVKSSQVQKCFKYIVHKHSFLHSGLFFFIFSDISYYIILIQRIVATIRMHNEKSIEKSNMFMQKKQERI